MKVRNILRSRTMRVGIPAFLASLVTVVIQVWELMDLEMRTALREVFGPEAFMLLSLAMLVFRVVTTKPLSER